MVASFARSIDNALDIWATAKDRKPLVLRGARQVGKTHSVRELALRHGYHLVEINFERKPIFKKAFGGDLSPSQIIPELEILSKADINIENSLLFLDEIQHCPEAIQALRFFYEDKPSLRVIAAGSLLEFALDKTPFPVGRVSFVWMFPLTFREFLGACGHQRIVKNLPAFPEHKGTLSNAACTEVDRLLREYLLVGGMPEAVRKYRDERSMAAVIKVHEELAISYLDDIRKHARGDIQLENTRHVLSSVFGFVGKQVNYTLLGQGDEIKRTKKSLDVLSQALLLHRVRCVSPAEIPLAAHSHDKYFKLIFLDVGLGQYLAGVNAAEVLKSPNLNKVFDGRLAEQFVGQELIANSGTDRVNRGLYYWARMAKGSAAELDYLIVNDGRIVGIEVKSGKGGSLKSLHQFLAEKPGLGVVMQDTHMVTIQDSLQFWPLYTQLSGLS